MGLLPENIDELQAFQIGKQPNLTYQMKIDEEQIHGKTSGLTAVEQACYKILNTERYQYVIYSWGYGIELQDLFGKPIPYVFAELPRRISEALCYDDRIKEVTNFELSHEKGDVLAKFEVVTAYGVIKLQKEVTIA